MLIKQFTTTTGVIAVDSVDIFGDHSSVFILMAQITPRDIQFLLL